MKLNIERTTTSFVSYIPNAKKKIFIDSLDLQKREFDIEAT